MSRLERMMGSRILCPAVYGHLDKGGFFTFVSAGVEDDDDELWGYRL